MKNLVRTIFGSAFIVLGIMTFVFDFMTVRNVADVMVEDPYPLQWVSVIAALFCAIGLGTISFITDQQSSDSKEAFVRAYHDKINWWTSFKHGLNHNLEDLGHALRILQ